MANFVIIFRLAFKRFFTLRRMAVFILILLLSLYAFHKGVQNYKSIERESRDFKRVEEDIFRGIRSWTDYSNKGTGVLFIPSPAMVFYAPPVKLTGLAAWVNTIASLDIFESRKGTSVTNREAAVRVRFSNIVLYVGTLLAILIGFASLRKREYLKQLAAVTSPGTVYAAITAAGFTIMVAGFLVILGSMYILGVFIGFDPGSVGVSGLQPFMLVSFIMLLFFMSAGSLIGGIRAKTTAVVVLTAVWFSYVLIIPVALDSMSGNSTGNIITAKELYGKKLKIVKEFEQAAIEKYGTYNKNNSEVERKIVVGYLNNEFKKMEALEREFLADIAVCIKKIKRISLPFITTFFQSTCDEISSNGYRNYLGFYAYLIRFQRNFLGFWINQVFFDGSKDLKNFINAQENLYFAGSKLPYTFWPGIVFHSLCVIVLLIVSAFRFKTLLLGKSRKHAAWAGVNIALEKGKVVILSSKYPDFNERFLSLFFGNSKSIDGEITLDGKPIDKKEDFLYISHPGDLPEDVRVGDYLETFKKPLNLSTERYQELKEAVGCENLGRRFGRLDDKIKADILMKLAEANKHLTVIFNGIDHGFDKDFRGSLQQRTATLKNNHILVIDIIADCIILHPAHMLLLPKFKENEYIVAVNNQEDW